MSGVRPERRRRQCKNESKTTPNPIRVCQAKCDILVAQVRVGDEESDGSSHGRGPLVDTASSTQLVRALALLLPGGDRMRGVHFTHVAETGLSFGGASAASISGRLLKVVARRSSLLLTGHRGLSRFRQPGKTPLGGTAPWAVGWRAALAEASGGTGLEHIQALVTDERASAAASALVIRIPLTVCVVVAVVFVTNLARTQSHRDSASHQIG